MSGAIRAQLIGATGYGGLGILELLLGHSRFEVASLIARDDAGRRIDEVYPHLAGRCELTVHGPDDVRVGEDCDVVVFATPDGVSQQHAAALASSGVRFIDYSGDFRFTSVEDYARYAERHPSIAEATHRTPELLGQNAYGVTELYADQIAGAPVVGNPGCFAIGIIVGMAPLYHDGLVDEGDVIVDGLTGSSGAGKKPAPLQHFSHLNDNVVPYRILSHQHVVEAEMALGRLGAAGGATVNFIPHLLGATRGILNTMHARLNRSVPREALLERYREYFAAQPFVRILDGPPTLKGTLGSNYVDISLFTSHDDRRVVVMSSIDNLMKGQSGSAMQNLNVMFGLPETEGLDRGPLYP
jgi:N-acetyl-gamma-glutamyl-phosphate reductase